MDALYNILNRVSARTLIEPHPTNDEMDKVFRGALRAPDHAWLRPSSFIQVTGEGIDRLSEIFEEYAKTVPNIKDEIISKYKNAPYRAPMIVILINSIKIFLFAIMCYYFGKVLNNNLKFKFVK